MIELYTLLVINASISLLMKVFDSLIESLATAYEFWYIVHLSKRCPMICLCLWTIYEPMPNWFRDFYAILLLMYLNMSKI